jgi:glycosyltransferase involved in cell wall biosynthesis
MSAVFCAKIMRSVPSVVSIDATPSQFAAMGAHYGLGDPTRASFRERIRERWYKDVFASARYVLGMSKWATDGAQRDYGVPEARTRVWYPGVDLGKWLSGPKSGDGPVRLLFVGGEFVRKGGDFLLRWMASGGNKRCTLDVVTRDPVEPVAGVTVHRGLEANDSRLLALYRASELFVLPTRADAASLVAVEAMASGTPVLTTRVGGIPEWLGPSGEAAVAIKPDNYDALRHALDRLVADRQRLREMGKRARQRAESLFDGRANVKRELTFLRELVSARNEVRISQPVGMAQDPALRASGIFARLSASSRRNAAAGDRKA